MAHRLKMVLGTAVVAAAIASGVALADDPQDKAVKARQSLMTLYSFNLGILGAMAKGAAEYNADAAAAAANNLLALSKLNSSGLWPKGTDNASMPGKTRALPDIWTTYPAVAEKAKALVAATEALAPEAGKDLKSLQAAIGPVGGACGGCHKTFRAEKS